MDIEGLSEATLKTFIDKGWLNDFTDIYRLGEHEFEITSLEGFGVKSWQRLQDAIQRSHNTTFERYLAAMDIPMIGRTASRELGRHFNSSLNAFETAITNGFDFAQLTNFGEVLHQNIHEWFSNEENKNLWKELQKMVNVENKVPAVTAEGTTATNEGAENPFTGKTIVVTGKLIHFTRNSIASLPKPSHWA